MNRISINLDKKESDMLLHELEETTTDCSDYFKNVNVIIKKSSLSRLCSVESPASMRIVSACNAGGEDSNHDIEHVFHN